MTSERLFEELSLVVNQVVADPRWATDRDDLGVSILGMLVYGLALAMGRGAMFLDVPDIDSAVLRVMTECVGASPKWSGGLVDEARASAFEKSHHPGQFELVGVGHQYWGVEDTQAVVDNVFTNIQRFRSA